MKILELINKNKIDSFNNYFNENIGNDKLQIVAFLADWCGYCQQFKPEWEKFKRHANKKFINGIVATASDKSIDKLNCDKNIQGFPTIRIFKNGNHMDYNGPRDSNNLINYIKKLESKSSLPYIKSNSCKKPKKIKIKISSKSLPISNDIKTIKTDVSATKKTDDVVISKTNTKMNSYGINSEKNNLKFKKLQLKKIENAKLRNAKKKISDHIILKLKNLSQEVKNNMKNKKLKKKSKTIKNLKKLIKTLKLQLKNMKGTKKKKAKKKKAKKKGTKKKGKKKKGKKKKGKKKRGKKGTKKKGNENETNIKGKGVRKWNDIPYN